MTRAANINFEAIKSNEKSNLSFRNLHFFQRYWQMGAQIRIGSSTRRVTTGGSYLLSKLPALHHSTPLQLITIIISWLLATAIINLLATLQLDRKLLV